MRVISMSAVALGPEMYVASAGGCGYRSKYSGNVSTTWLARRDAEVPIGQEGENAPTFRGGVVEDDGSRVGDAAGRRGYDAFGLLNFGGSQAAVELPGEAGGEATLQGVRQGPQSCACRWPQAGR